VVTILLILAVVAWSVLTSGIFLWLGAKWLRIVNITFKRSLAAAGVLAVLGIIINVGVITVKSDESGALGGLVVLGTVVCVGLVIIWAVLARLFRTSLAKAALAWLIQLIPTGLNIALVFWIIKPFALEAFIMPTNSSAPALIGYHKSAPCPHCGGLMVVPYDPKSPAGQDDWDQKDRDQLAICRACMRTANVKGNDISQEVGTPDRFVCNKLLFPHRWDMAVFHPPFDPSVMYVKRLVGLPGEKIFFKEGALCIDDKKLAPPADIAKLVMGTPLNMPDGWGTPERPALLGADEYFVAGDFALRSLDSRNWRGAQGHPSYALPRSHIVGVATAIYWPPSRWRLFR
jgi:signal peptidase I